MSLHTVQRLRIVFGKGAEIKYISHLDLMRAWERALRRAAAPLAYSQGFNPRPKLFFAAALPVGCTGRAELLDVILERRMDLHEFASRLQAQLPRGLRLASVSEVPLALPSLPSQVVAAEYEVLVQSQDAPDVIESRLRSLLAAGSIPRSRERPDGVRLYDLRPLIHELYMVRHCGNSTVIGMRLQADAQGTGRADEMMAALGMAEAVRSIERVRLLFCSQ